MTELEDRDLSDRGGDESLGRLAQETGRLLFDLGWTIGIAESCTGGLLTKLLTDVPGSSRYVRGCVVSYSNESKARLLGVDEAAIEQYGAVSELVAKEMAVGAARVLGADIGVGVTGIAGPDGGTEEKPVGTVWFGLSANGRTVARLRHIPGNRSDVRVGAARAALELIRDGARESG